jgi:hypothetical protein
MLKSEVIDFSTNQKYTISYFEDDTVNVVRQRIASALNTHQDRLFILVSLKLPHNYYQKDPRRWESLFDRLSYNNQPITNAAFQEYATTYRTPAVSLITFSEFDRTEWMSKPEDLEELYDSTNSFTEYRIFGVEESKSFILPFKFDASIASKIPAARTPLPMITTLISTLYKHDMIEKFLAIPYDSTADTAVSIYFPFYRSTTPNRISDEEINLLDKNTKLIKDLLELKVFEPVSISLTYVKFYAKFINTDFGSAARTRFEQIFYGLTLSKEVPYIQYFTGKNQISRHKFYVDDPKTKKPYLDMNMWSRWNSRPPQRNYPTLLLYRGKSKEHYDRISITPEDISITLYRNDENDEKIPEMKKEVLKWIKEFDSIMTFIEKEDIDTERFELQDVSFFAKYSRTVNKLEFLRFNCITSIFNKTEVPTRFAFLRTDSKLTSDVSPVQIKVIQLLDEGVRKPKDIAKELNVTVDEADKILKQVEDIIDNDPNILDRVLRGFPLIQIGDNDIKVSGVNEVDRIIKFANILRYIVGFSSSRDLDDICPKRMETVKADTAVIPANSFEPDEAFDEQYADLFGYLEDEEVVEEKPVKKEEPKEKSVLTEKGQETLHNYFQGRLIKFDRKSFDPKNNETPYAKKCERDHQPIILDNNYFERMKDTEYDPQTYLKPEFMESTVDPEGLIICPEYWCIRDEIPLTQEQLIEEDGEFVCPLCYNKIRTSDSDDLRYYTVIKRKEGFNYPGFNKYKFSKSGKNMPCCFRTPSKKTGEEKADEKYYIVNEDKLQLKPLQTSFISKKLLDSLQIEEDYELFPKKRIANGMAGFFRVGLGNPSETLPELLGLKTKVASPRESVGTVLKCSFLRSWKKLGDSNLTSIENSLRKIPPYDTDDYVRKNLAAIISGIDDAFQKKELSLIQELEYCAVFLQCDVFRVFPATNTLGCMFYSPLVRSRTKGIVIFQNNNIVDILSHVTRVAKGFQYKSNIFEIPFKKDTFSVLEKLRSQSCTTKVPSYNDALKIIKEILIASEQDDFQIVLDPFGRAQSFFVKKHMILPFNPSPLPDSIQTKIIGYSEIQKELLPTHENVLKYLEIAAKYSEGYKWVEDLYNTNSERVEVLVKSGLRIPIYPEKIKQAEPLEIIDTVNELTESKLVYGEPSEELESDYKNLSYSSEIYEFLIFELTNDIKEDYKDLRASLQKINPSRKEVEPLLREWFDRTVEYVKVDKPIEFLSKVRTPCGQFKSKNECNGNLCAWNGKTCKVEVRQSVRKEPLFHRLLATLVDNIKIRAMVLDGRTSPFFSTVLYLALPNELIVTDSDLVNILV